MRPLTYLTSILILSFITIPLLCQNRLTPQVQAEIATTLQQAKDFEVKGDLNQAATLYSQVAKTYWVNGAPNAAIENFNLALQLANRMGNRNAVLNFHNSIGMVCIDNNNFSLALENFRKSFEISTALNRKPDMAMSLLNIGNAHLELGNLAAAIKNFEEALLLAKELNDPKLLRSCYSQLAETYQKQNNQAKATEYFTLYAALTKKIQQDETRKRESEAQAMVQTAQQRATTAEAQKEATAKELASKQQVLEETEKNLEVAEQLSQEQQMQIELLNKDKLLKEATIRAQRMVRNIFIVIVIASLAFAVLVYKNLKEKKRANRLLAQQKQTIEKQNIELQVALEHNEKQNRNITSSINYAQRIQQALMPTEDALQSVIPQSFVLLEPRDIVSGDFMWFTGYTHPKKLKGIIKKHFIRMNSLNEDESGILISAVDCTGHGVPGAFMSTIGVNLLETITRNGVVAPNEILNELHLSVRYLLKQQISDNTDGMDMSLCAITNNGRQLLFSGARNHLITITNNELTIIKGDPVPIGGPQFEELRIFTLHQISIDAPTNCYLFTDGYIDQFGGIGPEKFSTRRFKDLLLKIYRLPLHEQKEILRNTVDNWRGNKYKQIDDILVVGFKIGDENIDI